MKIRPINGRVLVRPLELSEKTEGGIVIPDTAQEKSQEAEVVAIAEDATEEVAVGDRIIYRRHAGEEKEIGEETLILLTADDLLAKYQDLDRIPE